MHTDTLPEQPVGKKKQGKLTIFASYFSGAGKSYAMLEAAERARQAGRDVAIGLPFCEYWPQTLLLTEQFEVLPCKTVIRDGKTDYEIDLDACLKRAPELILVDDISHSNVDGSRHRKRYQDMEELLKAGVDVYTTLNVQHIEGIQNSVFSVLGAYVSERIPDRVFDQAAGVEFIDIEPERLQQRLFQQKKEALLSKCTLSQLSALREIGLRRCADRAALQTQDSPRAMEYRTYERTPNPGKMQWLRIAVFSQCKIQRQENALFSF